MAARRLIFGLIAAVGLLAGCEPDATPLPVVISTAEIAPKATAAPAETAETETALIRYGMTPFVAALADVDAPNIEIITTDAQTPDMDIFVSLDPLPDAQTAPAPLNIALVLSPASPLISDAGVTAAVRFASRGEDAPAQRVALANAGYPDGITLRIVSAAIPDWLTSRLSAANITTQTVDHDNPADALASGRADALLIGAISDSPIWGVWREQVGADNIIALADAPLYYIARADVNITFTPNGFPLPDAP